MIRLITFLIVGVLILQSCGKKDDIVPNIRFEVSVNLLQSQYSGNVFSLNALVNDPITGQPMQAGLSGIIVYNVGADRYNAFERYCPHDKDNSCKVSLKQGDSERAVCSCCKSEYLSMTGEAIEGSPSKYGLKQYRASKGSGYMANYLIISN